MKRFLDATLSCVFVTTISPAGTRTEMIPAQHTGSFFLFLCSFLRPLSANGPVNHVRNAKRGIDRRLAYSNCDFSSLMRQHAISLSLDRHDSVFLGETDGKLQISTPAKPRLLLGVMEMYIVSAHLADNSRIPRHASPRLDMVCASYVHVRASYPEYRVPHPLSYGSYRD
jgi:hypothetical protein